MALKGYFANYNELSQGNHIPMLSNNTMAPYFNIYTVNCFKEKRYSLYVSPSNPAKKARA